MAPVSGSCVTDISLKFRTVLIVTGSILRDDVTYNDTLVVDLVQRLVSEQRIFVC